MLTMITIEEFKQYFTRDFPYLPEYNENKIYYTGDEVYSSPNFYQSLIDQNTEILSNREAWQPIKDDVNSYLSDTDIEKAINEATLNFNADLFAEDCCSAKIPLLYLTAYYLVVDIKNATSGLSSNAYSSFIGSKSVGNVSESYAIPAWVQNNPALSLYMDNGYGKKYLTYLIPRTSAFLYLAQGGTTLW